MKNKLLHWTALLSLIGIAFFNLNYSSNPPIDRTNRTGSTCNGCHSGTLNPSGGSLSLSTPSSYYPGSSYTLNVTQTGGSRYGFEMTSVESGSTNNGAGTFSSSTGINVASQSGRSYARHANKNASGTWAVSWSAPSTNVGTVRFYIAGVSANNDGRTSSDRSYATTVNMTALNKISYTISTTSNPCSGDSLATAKLSAITGGAGGPYVYAWSANNTGADSAMGLWAGSYQVSVYDKDSNLEVKSFNITSPSAISASMITSNTICNDSTGSAIVQVSGGTAPYALTWPSGITTQGDTAINLKKGTYTVMITDGNGCMASATGTVGNSGSNITSSTGSLPEYCGNMNGIAWVNSVQGAAGNPSFIWSNTGLTDTITGLASGTYYVTISDDSSCVAYDTVLVQAQVSLDSLSTSVIDDKCGQMIGGASVDSLYNNIGGVQYVWSNSGGGPSINGMAKDTVWVTVVDSVGCSITDTLVIGDEDAPIIMLAGTNLNCFGDSSGSINSTVSNGVQPYVYSWSNNKSTNNISNLAAGTYVLTVTDSNSCIAVDSLIITQPDQLVVDSIKQTSESYVLLCDEEAQVWVSGGTPAYSITWNSGSNDTTANNLCDSTYTVSVSDANGCSVDTSIQILDYISSTEYQVVEPTYSIYPNPARSEILITGLSQNTELVQLFNVQGREVLQFIPSGRVNKMLDVSSLQRGSYWLRVTDGNQVSIAPIILH